MLASEPDRRAPLAHVQPAAGDPCKSLEERYKDHDGFVKTVAKAAQELVHERFLLPDDADTFVQAAQDSDVLK